MRTFGSELDELLSSSSGVQYHVRADIYKARNFFSAFTRNNLPGGVSQSAGINDTPIPQAMAYDQNIAKVITAYIHDTKLYLVVDGSAVGIAVTYSSATIPVYAHCKPGIVSVLAGTYVFVCKTDDTIMRYTIDAEALELGTPECLSDPTEVATGVEPGALHGISATEVVHFFPSCGGVGVTYYAYITSTWQVRTRPAFMFPIHLIDPADGDDIYWTNFTAAASSGGANPTIYTYVSSPNGSILGSAYSSLGHGWSDVFVVVPADLSRYRLTGGMALPYGGVLLVGQFQRQPAEVAPATYPIYNLAIQSVDGYTFGLDRFSLFSLSGYQFSVCLSDDNTKVFYGDLNRVCEANALYLYVSSDTEEVLEIPPEDILGFDGRMGLGGDQWSLRVANGSGQYFDSLAARSNLCKVYIGAVGENQVPQEVLWGTYVINSLRQEYRSGIQSMVLELVSDAMWRLQTMSYPLYLEFQAKQVVMDDCDEVDNLYTASNMPANGTLVVDLWGSDKYQTGGGLGPITSDDAHSIDVVSPDLTGYLGLSGYPVVTSLPLTASVYGWARTETGDSGYADTWDLIVVCEDAEGGEFFQVVGGQAEYPLQTYVTSHGDYPIEYTLDETVLELGWKVKKLGIRSICDRPTQFYPERIEIPGLRVTYSNQANTAWSQVPVGDGGGLRCPGLGKEFIMFSQQPYSAFDFQLLGHFDLGGEYSYAGLVGLAQDASNLIGMRFNTAELEFFKMRDGILTRLGSPVAAVLSGRTILFIKSGSEFSVRVWDNIAKAWGESIASYTWQVSDGVMFTSGTGVMHVGIYGYCDVPRFRIAAFDVRDSEGIPMLPDQDTSLLTPFPSSGKVKIGTEVFSYDGKTTDEVVLSAPAGPFQFRRTKRVDRDYSVDGHTYQEGRTFEFSRFVWQSDGAHYNDQLSLLAAMSSGHVWLCGETDWKVRETIRQTSPLLLNRCRVWSSRASKELGLGLTDKVWICHGLLVETPEENEDEVTETTLHTEGEWCYLDMGDFVIIRSFFAASADSDASMADLLTKVCRLAGADLEFPGDRTLSSLALTPGTLIEI